MDNINHLLVVFTAYVIAAGSPGPSTLRIMGVAMNQGRQAGLALAAGVISGSLFWGLSAATGVSAFLARYAGPEDPRRPIPALPRGARGPKRDDARHRDLIRSRPD